MMQKQQNFALTPDIHSKAYMERHGMTGVTIGMTKLSPGLHLQTSAGSG
jgi:hypothetical protein